MTTIPASLRQALPAAISEARRQLAPPATEAVDETIAMIALLPSKSAGTLDGQVARAAYHVGLSDIPADLLRLAANEAIRSSKFRPSPAELRGFVAEQMAERRRRLHRLEAAQNAEPPREVEKVSPEEIQAIYRETGFNPATAFRA